jgi:octaprenyl-diphosphate synthase
MRALAGTVIAPDQATFIAPIADELRAVERRLQAGLDSRSKLISEVVTYILAGRGKRMRPAILLLVAKLCGYTSGERHIELAAATEYMHAATLVHDDIIDAADERRGLPAAHVKWGSQVAVLVGDFLYARAIKTLVADGDIRILDAFADATVSLSEGEVLEVETAGNVDLTCDTYLETVMRKTAALISAASRAGALIAQSPEAQVQAMADFGLHLGIGFQLVDDALDYMGYKALLGKPVGQDIREGKVTYPLIAVMQHAPDDVKQRLRCLFSRTSRCNREVTEIRCLVEAHRGIAATMAYAKDVLTQAQADLNGFPCSAVKRALLEIVGFVLKRAW